MNNTMNREETMNALRNARNNMQPVWSQEQLINQQGASLSQRRETVNQKNQADQAWHGFSVTRGILRFFGWWTAGGVISIPLSFIAVILMGKPITGDNVMDTAVGFGFLFPLIMMPFGKKIKRAIRNSRLKKHEIKADRVIQQAEQEIQNYVASRPEIFGFLPAKYVRTHAIDKFLEYFTNARVDTLREAINLYEQESTMYA